MSDVFLTAPILPVLASAPASPVLGMAYIRASDTHVLVYDGAAWVDQAAGSSVLKQTACVEVTADTTTTSTSFVDLLTQNITTGAGFLMINFSVSASNSNGITYQRIEFQILVDGVAQRGTALLATTAGAYSAALNLREAVAAGAHVVKVQWRVGGNTGRIRPVTTITEHASLCVSEVTA